MSMKIKKIEPSCNINTLKDKRGAVLTYYPLHPIVEWNMIYTNAGQIRGMHYHEEFYEYVIITKGHGIYVEKSTHKNKEDQTLAVSVGDSICIPPNVAHVLHAITDMHMIVMLTKKWIDCASPTVSI